VNVVELCGLLAVLTAKPRTNVVMARGFRPGHASATEKCMSISSCRTYLVKEALGCHRDGSVDMSSF
jgi:hypothetical protein